MLSFVAEAKCFWEFRNKFWVSDANFSCAINVAYVGKQGNILPEKHWFTNPQQSCFLVCHGLCDQSWPRQACRISACSLSEDSQRASNGWTIRLLMGGCMDFSCSIFFLFFRPCKIFFYLRLPARHTVLLDIFFPINNLMVQPENRTLRSRMISRHYTRSLEIYKSVQQKTLLRLPCDSKYLLAEKSTRNTNKHWRIVVLAATIPLY